MTYFSQQSAVITFEDDVMDSAYKCLEATQKYCETSSKKFGFLSSSSKSLSSQERMSVHEKLYRRSIVADCLLFQAILVFLKQGITSYVKGGYLLRKAWKMYEKIYQETEQICSKSSPILKEGETSLQDNHVGSSIYDRQGMDFVPEQEEEEEEEEEEEMEDEKTAQLDSSLGNVGDSLAGMHLGFAMVDGDLTALTKEEEEEEKEGEKGNRRLPAVSIAQDEELGASTKELNAHRSGSHDGGSHSNHLSVHDGSSSSGVGMMRTSSRGSTASTISQGNSNSLSNSQPSSLTSSRASSRSGSEENLRLNSLSVGLDAGVDSVDNPNGKVTKRRAKNKKKKKMKRPQSGFFLPGVPSPTIQTLEHEDDRLRGAVYFGFGLMNIIVSLIPPKLMKLANLFGFHGNRRVGLQALEFSSNSQDMKAPLARCVILFLTFPLSTPMYIHTPTTHVASFPGPAQLSVACSTIKRGEPGVFSHVSMT